MTVWQTLSIICDSCVWIVVFVSVSFKTFCMGGNLFSKIISSPKWLRTFQVTKNLASHFSSRYSIKPPKKYYNSNHLITFHKDAWILQVSWTRTTHRQIMVHIHLNKHNSFSLFSLYFTFESLMDNVVICKTDSHKKKLCKNYIE